MYCYTQERNLQMFNELTKLLDGFIEMGIPGYDCVVYHKGKCVYRHSNGYSDKANRIPINGKEFYNLYSCSKVITCTAALMLYERGFYKLEDKLSKYMPEFENMTIKSGNEIKKAKNSIKIENLFCMTAGFSYDLNSPQLQKCKEETDGRCPTRETMKYLAKEPLLFEPGEGWKYSLCHDVLAALVEVLSGKKFGQFVEENIFAPLGIKNSTFLLDEDDIDKVSTQYRYNPEIKTAEECSKKIAYRIGSEYESGGAGCVSTVDDYICFLEGLRNEKLISKETLKLMSTDRLTQKQQYDFYSFFNKNYGYGLGVRCPRDGSTVTDFGWDGAAGSYLLIDMKNEITAFYAQHVLNHPNIMERHQIAKIIRDVVTNIK